MTLTERVRDDIWHDPVQGEALIEHLIYLHGEGCSFGVIGQRIGITRNAAAGKASRLGLLKHHPQPKMMLRPLYQPRHSHNLGFNRGKFRPRVEKPKRKPRERAAYNTLCLIWQLENKHCRWPVWKRDDAPINEKFFCGAPADLPKGLPYCAAHGDVAFN